MGEKSQIQNKDPDAMPAKLWFVLGATIVMLTSPTARADHYEVFLVGGQSNCDGRGSAASLTGPLAKWAKPQEDVLIAYSCSNLRGPVLTSEGFKPLQPGWSVAPGRKVKSVPSGTFGPELAFGRDMADKLASKHVALIKYTEGGTSLSKDWNPAVKNRLYDAFLAHTAKSLKELKDKGHTYTVHGMIWHQGESDAGLPAGEYQKLLTTFIEKVRTDLATPDLLFGIGEVYDNGKRDAVRAGEKATAEAVKGTFLVSAADLKTSDMGTHFDAPSQLELGHRFAAGMLKAMGKP
jgi:iduronate 2-sulfatase